MASPNEATTLRDRFLKLYAGAVSDALDFDVGLQNYLLHWGIKPLVPGTLIGPAFTCHGQRVEDEARHDTIRLEMLDAMPPHAVLVVDGLATDLEAHFGDITAQLVGQRKCVGVVLDGFTRDSERLKTMPLPVYCRGTSPLDAYGRWEIVEYGGPIKMAGYGADVTVRAGDWLFGDSDGVMVIPHEHVAAVCTYAENRAVNETVIRSRLKSENPMEVYRRLGRW